MIDPTVYLKSLGIDPPIKRGGQELILGEIVGALAGLPSVWLPFYSSGALAACLQKVGIDVVTDPLRDTFEEAAPPCRGLYFGTPTIVNDAALFPEKESWTKQKERLVVRDLVRKAEAAGYQRIVSGLGSGDVNIHERMEDMGKGAVVCCLKHFGTFKDWVLVREL